MRARVALSSWCEGRHSSFLLRGMPHGDTSLGVRTYTCVRTYLADLLVDERQRQLAEHRRKLPHATHATPTTGHVSPSDTSTSEQNAPQSTSMREQDERPANRP